MKKAMDNVLAFFGWKALPQKDGKYHLSDEQQAELDANVGVADFAKTFLEKANEELEAQAKVKQLEEKQAKMNEKQKAALAELKKIASDTGIKLSDDEEDEEEDKSDGGETTAEDDPEALEKRITSLGKKVKELAKQRDTLANEDEPDNPEIIYASEAMKTLGHTATHVFGTGKPYDAIEGRQWNQNLIYATTGQRDKIQATDWTDSVNIDKINSDLADYARLELDKVVDVMGDFRGIPSWWDVITNVDDEISYTAIINGEITQGRKKKFLAKNRQKFVAMKGKVYPVQIDAEWEGWKLQKIETSWMNRYNKEGSQPHKWSFVYFLMQKLLEQARKEDNQALIKGVYFPDEEADAPMSFIHRMKGLIQLIAENRGKYFRPFDIGAPTTAGIIDYVRKMCDSLPEEKRNMPDLIYYLSPSWLRKYKDGIRVRDGLNQDYDPKEMTVEHYPNITLYPLEYLEGEDLHFITTKNNIMILENIPAEKSMIKFDTEKRNIIAMGDYKLGIHVEAFGAKWNDGDPVDFNMQIFWSNNVEVNTTTSIPVEPGDPTPSVLYHNVLKTGANTGATAITNLEDAVDGRFYYIYGNSEGTPSTIASGANFNLESNITLTGNMMIKLWKYPSGKFMEIYRKDLSTTDYVELAQDATTADAADGTRFLTSTDGNTGATAFTDIENAVDGQIYRLEGGSDQNATTIAAEGKFSRITGAMTLGLGEWIDVIYNAQSGKFVELNRNEIA